MNAFFRFYKKKFLQTSSDCFFLFSLSFFLSLSVCVDYPFLLSEIFARYLPLAYLTPLILAVSFLSSTIRPRPHQLAIPFCGAKV